MDIVKIHPKAANAFDIEIYNNLGKLSYVLDVHTDGERLHILPKDADRKVTTLVAVEGYSSETQQKIMFRVLCIKPSKEEIRSKMKIGDIVEIFEDPVTCKKSEGKARLLRLHKDDFELQYWRVQFLADKGSQYNRWIKKKEI